MDWEKIRMNSMVYEWSIFYQKAKKYLKNDGLTSGGPRVHLAGAPTGQIWDSQNKWQ